MTTEQYKEYSKNWEKQIEDIITPSFLPNGVYRVLFHIYNDIDTVGFTINYQYEVYFRLNDDIF